MGGALEVSYRQIWRIAYPIMLGSIAEMVMNLVNTAFVSGLGDEAIGAVGLGGMWYLNFVMLALGLGIGAQIIMGRRNGEQQYREIGRVLDNNLYLFTILGLTMLGLMMAVSKPALRAFIHSDAVYSLAVDYVDIRMFGIVFVCISTCFRGFYVSTTRTKYLTAVAFSYASLNVVLDYLLIFGHWGLPAMGVSGAGVASLISEFFAAGVYIVLSLKKESLQKYAYFRFPAPDLKIIAQVLTKGSPLMLQNWVSFSSWFFFFLVIEKLGEGALAISSIVRSVYALYIVVMFAFANSTNTIVSNLLGEGKADDIPKMVGKILRFGGGFVLAIALANAFFSHSIISIFTQDDQLIQQGQRLLYIISVAMLIFMPAFTLLNVVTGSGDTKAAMWIELAAIAAYSAFILIFAKWYPQQLVIIWLCEPLYMLTIALGSAWRVRGGAWRHQHA